MKQKRRAQRAAAERMAGDDDAVDVRVQDADDALAHHVAQCLRDLPEARALTAAQVRAVLRDALRRPTTTASHKAWATAKRAYRAYQACRWVALGYTVLQAPAVTRVLWWASAAMCREARR